MKKRLLSFLAMLLCSAAVLATNFTVGGIKYNITSTDELTVGVTSGGEYSGEIVIPASVQYDGNTYCVTSIGDRTFYGCSGLTSVTIPSSVTSIGWGAFGNTGWYNAQPDGILYLDNWLLGYKRDEPTGEITIKSGTKGLADGAFYNCSGLTSVTIPNSVTSIGEYAFEYCSGLTSITIPSSVTSIGVNPFAGCSGLTSIVVEEGNTVYDSRDGCNAIINDNELITGCKNSTIPNSVTSIGGSAFSHCSSLTSIIIPNSVTSIGYAAFCGCSGLTSITIPNSVTSIGDSAFENCSGLTSVTIGNSVTSIGKSAFFYCSGLTSITIGNSVKSIGVGAFRGCSGLTFVTIPSSVTSIGISAFYGCSGLTSVTIPNSVTSIGNEAFCVCSGLTSIVVEAGNTVYDSRDGCNAIIKTSDNELITGCKNTTIPNSVTSIGWGAFRSCSGLTSVTIPNSVTSIGYYAFSDCSGLTSVTIGNSVMRIKNSAFEGCSGLTSITVQRGTPVAITQDVFNNRTNATLYVPVGSKDFYEHADYWKEFKEIKEVEGMIDVSILDDALYAEDVTAYPDGATCFPILMKNKESITNIQFDVVLPEGVTIKNSTLTNRKGSDHAIATSSVNGATRFMVTSMGGKVFSDNDGAVINLSLAIDKNLAAGHQEITLRNITLSTSGAVKVNTPTCMAVLTVSDIESGDADGDGVTDVNDVTSTINHILKKPVASFVRGAADVDGDDVIDVNDVQATIDKALGKTSSSRGKNRHDEEPALDPQ